MLKRVIPSFVVAGAALLVASTVAAQWGTVTGQFVYDGKAPAPKKLVITKDVEVCGKHNLVDEALVVGADGGLANVAIWLDDSAGPVAVHPGYASTAAAKLVLDNKNCRFEPRIATLRTTQPLTLTNSDPVQHNVKGEPRDADAFNPLIPSMGSIDVKIPVAQALPVPVSCSIHPWMNGYVVVQKHPYMAVSGTDGKFTLKDLPVGKFTFVVWSGRFLRDVTMGGKKESWRRGRVEITVKAGDNDLGVIKVAPSNFEF